MGLLLVDQFFVARRFFNEKCGEAVGWIDQSFYPAGGAFFDGALAFPVDANGCLREAGVFLNS